MAKTLIRHVHQKFPLVMIGGQVVGQVCADPGARSPIGVSGNFTQLNLSSSLLLDLSKPKLNQHFNLSQLSWRLDYILTT